MRKSTTPQGGSLLACTITQGRLRCTCQPCAIESITPMGRGTPCGLVEMGRGGLRVGRLMPLGQIVCKWLFCLCGIAWKNMMEMGRGGAYVPTRVALQGRIHRSFPAHNACIFWYGNAAVRTFGRAHRHRPYGFVWADCAWTVDFIWGWIVHGLRIPFGWVMLCKCR